MLQHRIIFASENINKIAEVEAFLQSNKDKYSNIILEAYKPPNEIAEIQSLNRNDIIKDKLDKVYHQLEGTPTKPNTKLLEKTWLVVEDTSLTIEKLGGFPGPFIKFFLNSIPLTNVCNWCHDSITNSIVSLGAYKLENESYIRKKNHCEYYFVEGNITGMISNYPVGNNGFGFDPIFIPLNSSNYEQMKTYAEMTQEEKNKYNPRTLAFQLLIQNIIGSSN
jgi:non-canonical purine NTP pyrophosphatase (RdgB/HAM1 family)